MRNPGEYKKQITGELEGGRCDKQGRANLSLKTSAESYLIAFYYTMYTTRSILGCDCFQTVSCPCYLHSDVLLLLTIYNLDYWIPYYQG